MNDFAYTVAVPERGGRGHDPRRRLGLQGHPLGRQQQRAFPFTLTDRPAGTYRFIGTPDQSMSARERIAAQELEPDRDHQHHLDAGRHLAHRPAERRRRLDAHLDGVAIPYTVAAGDDVASRVALQLAALIRLAGYTVEARVGILGDSVLLITRPGGPPSPSASRSPPPPARTSPARPSSPARRRASRASDFTMAAAQILTPGAAGTIWTLTLGRARYSLHRPGRRRRRRRHHRPRPADHARPTRRSSPAPRSRSRAASRSTSTGNPLVPAAGDEYVVNPLNLNTRVDESTQVDTLNVDNSNSPQNDTGTLTENHISGLGMGGDTVIAGEVVPGRHHLLEHRDAQPAARQRQQQPDRREHEQREHEHHDRGQRRATRSTSTRSAATPRSRPAPAPTRSTSRARGASSSSAAC